MSQIQKDFEKGLPMSFNSYSEEHTKAYYENLCDSTTITTLDCTTAESEILQRGAKTSIYALLTNAKQLIITFNGYGPSITLAQRIELIRSIYMAQSEEVFAEVSIVMDYLISLFIDNLKDYRNLMLICGISALVVNIMVLVIVIVFIWNPYLNELNNTMIRTRGMLNMIPMEIIIKTPNLKAEIVGGELLKAVR